MAWIGAAVAVAGSLLSSSQQAGAASDAASQQANAQNQATASQMAMFNTQNAQQQPYRDAGQYGLNALQFGLGIGNPQDPQSHQKAVDAYLQELDKFNANPGGGWTPSEDSLQKFIGMHPELNLTPTAATQQQQGGLQPSYFQHQFNAQDLNANLAPNYEFMKQQGIGATQNLANASGGALGGNSLQGITQFAENYAGNAYQQAYNNYTANQSNIFNRLSTLAGLGSASNQQSAGLAGTLAPSIGNSIAATGAAQASGTIGRANATAGGLNNALGWYQLGNFLNPGGSTTTDPGFYNYGDSLLQ